MNFKNTMRFSLKTLPGFQKPRLELLMQEPVTFEDAIAWAKETTEEIRKTRIEIQEIGKV